jgi:hypothetical protein
MKISVTIFTPLTTTVGACIFSLLVYYATNRRPFPKQCQDWLVDTMSEFVLPLLGLGLNKSLLILRNHCVIKISPKFKQKFKVMHQKRHCQQNPSIFITKNSYAVLRYVPGSKYCLV